MPILEPDFSELDQTIPAGTYKATITECDAKTSKTGNMMAVPKFSINVDGKARTRQAYLVVSGAGAFNFQALLKAAGFSDVAERLKAGEKVPFDTDSLVNQEVMVVIEPDEYNGQPSDKIKTYLPV